MTYNFCTYFDSHYLYKGITMYRSLLGVCDDFKLWILCFDDLTYGILSKMKLKNVELISLLEFEDKDLQEVKKDRSLIEYYLTCTPSLPLYILNRYRKLDMITYLDADIYFFSDPYPIFEEFGNNSILLIEHRYVKNVERNIKRNGRYNVQFMTFKNDKVGINALEWWRERCLEWCHWRIEDGKMGDQKYLDDWTSRFENVYVLQNKGAGLGPWNVIKYKIKLIGNKILVDEVELIFYHFHFLKMYSKRFFNLSTYKLSKEIINYIYIPYLKAIRETIYYVKKFDDSFNLGYSSLKLDVKKDYLRTIMAFFRGNFLYDHKFID